MRATNVLGIIYSNGYDDSLKELTALRTMGSVPFCGRYRLIDFVLSNMVNCGMTKVGVITNANYNSLMDHIGSGRPWDLSRKRDGLFLLPPFYSNDVGKFNNRLNSLIGMRGFIAASKQEYVILSDCNVVCNMDYEKLFETHEKNGADITVCYSEGAVPSLENLLTFDINANSKILKAKTAPADGSKGCYSLNIFVMRKSLLEGLLNEAVSLNYSSFEKEMIQNNIERLNVFGYKSEGFCRTIDSLKSYYEISMELLNVYFQRDLFCAARPIFTKTKDDVPAIYGLDSKVKNSLIADGCLIEGSVENCILFRGAKVSRGAIVKNSIIMQGAFIGDEAMLNCIIADKNVTVKPHKTLMGDKNYPFYIAKGLVI